MKEHSITPTQVQIVQRSFAQIAESLGPAGELFYRRLFEIRPQLRLLFKNDIQGQGRKLMDILGFAVREIGNPSYLSPVLEELGKKHRNYGVRLEDYETGAEALLQTLREMLGSYFTSEVQEAWVSAYAFLANSMHRGSDTM
jgi:nitric oxide dioxygenase